MMPACCARSLICQRIAPGNRSQAACWKARTSSWAMHGTLSLCDGLLDFDSAVWALYSLGFLTSAYSEQTCAFRRPSERVLGIFRAAASLGKAEAGSWAVALDWQGILPVLQGRQALAASVTPCSRRSSPFMSRDLGQAALRRMKPSHCAPYSVPRLSMTPRLSSALSRASDSWQ